MARLDRSEIERAFKDVFPRPLILLHSQYFGALTPIVLTSYEQVQEQVDRHQMTCLLLKDLVPIGHSSHGAYYMDRIERYYGFELTPARAPKYGSMAGASAFDKFVHRHKILCALGERAECNTVLIEVQQFRGVKHMATFARGYFPSPSDTGDFATYPISKQEVQTRMQRMLEVANPNGPELP